MNAHNIGRYRWTICALLFCATTINYLDRQVLSLTGHRTSAKSSTGVLIATTPTSQRLSIPVYAIAMLFAGRFIDRIGTKPAF